MEQIETNDGRFLSVGDVAERLYLSKSAVYHIIETDSSFPHMRIGGAIQIGAQDLDKWINKHALQ